MDGFVPVIFAGVLHLEDGPTPEVLQAALTEMQRRNLALRVALERQGKAIYFVADDDAALPLTTRPRDGDTGWRVEVECHLIRRFGSDHGALFRVKLSAWGGAL